jgi:myo-inositol-1(or 4)-monophosphatase
MHPMVNIADKAARAAGNLILKASERMDKVKIIQKGPRDFATEVDLVAEQEIIQIIHSAYPDHKIVAEESGESEHNAECVWIIDPLDGTTNFIHGFPHYAVSIAYQYRGKIEHGVIYDPIRDEMFSASRGRGARLNNTRLRVSECQRLEQALVGTGFPTKHLEDHALHLKLFGKIFSKAAGESCTGSAALDLAYVAAGRLDAFWEMKLKPWDFAAGILLIKEAGGMVGDFQGAENYLDSGNIVAGNLKLFKALLQEISPEI